MKIPKKEDNRDEYNKIDKNGNLDMSLAINKKLDVFMDDLEKGKLQQT